MVIVANAYGCTQGPFWLSGRTALKINGHDSLSTTKVSFLLLFAYAYAYVLDLQQLPKCEYSAQIWHYRRSGNLTIFDKDDDTVEREQL